MILKILGPETGSLSNIALNRGDFWEASILFILLLFMTKYKSYLCKLENKEALEKNSPFDFLYKNNAKIITFLTEN